MTEEGYVTGKRFLIRRAEAGDYEQVRHLEELEFEVHRRARPDYFKAQEEGYTRREFEEQLSLPCPVAWLAVQDGRVAGLCFGKIADTPGNQVCKSRRVAFVEDLVTLPEYRGQGIATALLARVREQAAEEGAKALELCVWNFNQGALQLYERLGMQVQYYRMEERISGSSIERNS